LAALSSSEPRPGPLDRAGLRRVLAVLCVTEITSWGILYYAFPVLSPAITADTGWSGTTTMAAFSVGQVTAALVGIPVGRALDRIGPRWPMTCGSLLGVASLVLLAGARSLVVFWAAWLVAGVAMAGVLYQPAFAALTSWWGERRVVALTAVTLVAGLASTVFAPLTAVLEGPLDWRQTYLVLAVVLALVTVPAHALGLRAPWPRTAHGHDPVEAEARSRAIVRSRGFGLLVLAMTLGGLAVYAVVFVTVPLVTERGFSTETAALALGIGGVGQVCGRLTYRLLIALAPSPTVRGVVVLAGAAVAAAVLAVVPGPLALMLALFWLTGSARGLFTLLQATAVSDRWGVQGFGRLNGLLSAPAMLAAASAPWLVAVCADALGSHDRVVLVLAGVAGSAALAMTGTAVRVRAGAGVTAGGAG
jgi:MFS family permease